MVFSGGRGYLFALSTVGQAWEPSVYHEACLDPGPAPWRCSENLTSLNWLFSSKGVAFRLAEEKRCMQNATNLWIFWFTPPLSHVCFRSARPPAVQHQSTCLYFFSPVCYRAAALFSDRHGRCFCVYVCVAVRGVFCTWSVCCHMHARQSRRAVFYFGKSSRSASPPRKKYTAVQQRAKQRQPCLKLSPLCP